VFLISLSRGKFAAQCTPEQYPHQFYKLHQFQ
jgi:hypothetical protein